MTPKPLQKAAPVTVVIPCHEGARFIEETLRSVLEQTRPPERIVVVDDGSRDGSPDLARGLSPRIELLVQENAGVSLARNAGALDATTPYLAFLDQDDLWTPHFLERQVARLEADPALGLVYADSTIIDARGRPFGVRSEWLDYREGPVFSSLLRGNFIPLESLVIRRELFASLRGFDPRWSLLEDWDLCLRAARRAPVAFDREPLARYRIHDRNLSHRRAAMARERLALLEAWSSEPDLVDADRSFLAEEMVRIRGELAWKLLRECALEEYDALSLMGLDGALRKRLAWTRRLVGALPRALARRLLERRSLYGVRVGRRVTSD